MNYDRGRIKKAPRHRIGSSVGDLPEIIRGMRRVRGWFKVAASAGLQIPEADLNRLITACNTMLNQTKAIKRIGSD